MPEALPSAAVVALACLVVYLINLAPAFMPPTWSILAFFLIHYNLPLAPLAVGGALAASAGRLTLALASRRWGRQWLGPKQRDDLTVLGGWLATRARIAAPVAVLFYSFGPIPSNQLFIAAGLTGIRLAPIVGAFLAGRLISYSFWALAARSVVNRFEDLFGGHWQNVGALAVEVVFIALLIAFTRIDWPRWLGIDAATVSGSTKDPLTPK